MAVTNIAELNALVERVKKAQREYASFTQEQVDKIFRAAALAAADARIPLAKMAVAESGMGIVEDKVIKNHFASEYIYNAYKDEKTCGVLSEDDTFGTITIAEPIGIICGIVPTTNPTSTAIFKSLISLKTRNAIINAGVCDWQIAITDLFITTARTAVLTSIRCPRWRVVLAK